MKAALYIRVSTEDQVEGFSLSAQKDALTDYCTKNNIQIYDIYSDEGISGQKENRPEFQRMIKDAEQKFFNIILVHKYDRFARKIELSQKVKTRLKKSNVNVISITEPIEDSPMGFFISGLHELLAEYYIRNLSQEVKKGMVERAKQGLHNGSVPYGFKIDNDGNMVIKKEQAIIVKKIFEMYNNGYGSVQISIWLQENKVPTAIPGARWNHHAILYILKNPKYVGYIKYAGEIYQGSHERIVDNETFELAQKFLKERLVKRSPVGKNMRKFTFLGLLRCGVCERNMSVSFSTNPKGRKYYYYACLSAHSRERRSCTNKQRHSTLKLEKEIMKHLEELLKIQTPLKSKKVDTNIIKEHQLKRFNEELSRAEAAYLAGVDDLLTYAKNKKNIKEKIRNISKETSEAKTDIKKELSNALEEFKNSKTPSEKRIILSRCIESITIWSDRINIDFK